MSQDLPYIIVVAAILWHLVKLLTQIIYKRFEHRLPASQQEMLERYAKMAVRYVEQGTTNIKGDAKKAVALDIIKKLLLSAKLPIPNMAILSAAIEAAVLVLNRDQQR